MLSFTEVPKKKERECTVVGKRTFYGIVPQVIPKKRRPRVNSEATTSKMVAAGVPGTSPEPAVIEPTSGGKFPNKCPIWSPA